MRIGLLSALAAGAFLFGCGAGSGNTHEVRAPGQERASCTTCTTTGTPVPPGSGLVCVTTPPPNQTNKALH